MRVMNAEETTATTDAGVVSEPEQAGEAAEDQRAEQTPDQGEWMLEEEGYGHGV